MCFPSPIAFWIGPWPVRWYGIAYAVGVILAWLYVRTCVSRFPQLTKHHLDGFINWGMIGIVVGGRLGHALFYYPQHYLVHPLEIFQVWKGGMAFHGGLLGVIIAALIYCRLHNLHFLSFIDIWACGAPIGLFFGRIANFINQELYGRITYGPWGIIFPEVDLHLRHPSQLYEAGLEGLGLFIILALLTWFTRLPQKSGILSGLFLIDYGLARWISEYFREPLEVSKEWGGMPLGQIYSVPMILGGIVWCAIVYHKNKKTSLL